MLDVVSEIIKLQTKHSLSNNALASASGLSQSTVQSIIKRGMIPTLPTLEKLCSALGITLAEFFAESEKQVDPNEARLLAAYRHLSEDKQQTVVTMVNALAKE